MIDSNAILSATLVALGLALSGCSQQPPVRTTLAELDRTGPTVPAQIDTGLTGQVANNDAKQAYYQFIRSAPQSDRARNQALARLADLELQDSRRWSNQDNYQEDRRFRDTLKRTIALLETALQEFPGAEGNDRKWYQLAKSHDQLGHHESSLNALQALVRQHPDSTLYPEAQFRLAESAFSRGDYLAAEIAYTAALHSSHDTSFHERALFKRGWARYKQSLFEPALEDFIAVIHAQDFPSASAQQSQPLSDEDRVIYDEYYRSFALTMIASDAPARMTGLLEKHNVRDWYAPYRATSQLLQAQGRTSDAVAQWRQLLETDPTPWTALRARANIVSLWREGGFHQKALAATDALYRDYQRHKAKTADDSSTVAQQGRRQLREHWKQAARYHHALYQRDGGSEHRLASERWYQRYLKDFEGYAQQDGIALAYGDLLVEAGRTEPAFRQYERAAFDGDVILNPEAAYAALALLNTLTDRSADQWLPLYLRYGKAFANLYPNDERTPEIGLNVARYAYQQQQYRDAIALADHALAAQSTRTDAYSLILQSQMHLKRYARAEQTASRQLALSSLPDSLRAQARQQRALSVYRQAQAAENQQAWNDAIRHYRRIHEQDPNTENAPKGLYNALSIASERERWDTAIALIQRFQSVYPNHDRRADAERQLSRAYLASGQTDAAARQYERLASSEQDSKAQRAAQWKAARLYLEQDDTNGAINAFRRYAHRYPTPYPQNAEAIHHMIELYAQTGDAEKRRFWQRKLLERDRQQPDNIKTARTRRLVATAALSLGRYYHQLYDNIALGLPLNQSLSQKTEQMQSAIQHYARAASFGLTDVASESTFRIGRIYETLAKALLASDRPTGLSDQARLQYDILLEDRAFPFEDKAIEFYERNLRRARQEGFNEWIVKSRDRLAVLFPVRYDRNPRAGFDMSLVAVQKKEQSIAQRSDKPRDHHEEARP